MAVFDGVVPAIVGAANSASADFEIERSLRFNDDDTAYLNRTPSSTGNRKTWTWSGWVKKAANGANQVLFSSGSGGTNPRGLLQYTNTDIIEFGENPTGSTWYALYTNAVYRDPGAWYHIVAVYDSSNATSTDRLRLYVNGVRIDSFSSSSYPSLNTDGNTNTTDEHRIGRYAAGSETAYLDGYLANVQFIDGQALAATDFGEYDDNNVWQPKAYSGSYGTNGFYLKFDDNSSASALGTDSSGNSNTWTVNNLSVTPGADNDSLIDTPKDYEASSGNNGGNYCILSPLKNQQTLSNGNLDVVGGSSWQRSVGTLGMYNGKYYWEYEITASNEHLIGVGPVDMQLGGNLGAGDPPGSGYGTELGQVNGTGANSSWTNTGGSTAGDLIGIAFDADNGNMYVYKNGSALNGGIASHTGLVMPQVPVVSLNGSSRSGVINFGQRPFTYTPPTGYVSLCTTNLADPTIEDGLTAFDVITATGTAADRTFTMDGGFGPDLVWAKQRNGSSNNALFDTLRGATKRIVSNLTQAEDTQANQLKSFTSTGFTYGSDIPNNSSQTGV